MSDIGVYQHHIKRLTDENRELREQLAKEKRSRRDEMRILKAQIRECLSPELLVLRRELRRWKDRATVAEGRLTETKRRSAS